MSERSRISRRRFAKLCASALPMLGGIAAVRVSANAEARSYNRVKLVDDDNQPIKARDLAIGESYVFHYPYVTTPCFLINLGETARPNGPLNTADGRAYKWVGGIGPKRSIVAFSAICAHQMSYPARSVSFINYRHDGANFWDKDKNQVKRAQVIYCCSEKSVYDPRDGARVIGGPAPQPLAAVIIEHDEQSDALYATGTEGGEMFDGFFAQNDFRLALEHRVSNVRQRARETTAVVSIKEYSSNRMMC
ncbi:MAG: (2Fe-2S)-binding protein [Gammaproteobacteria bacterium]